MRHELKTWPEPFSAMVEGRKRFEIRREGDRVFSVGDSLHLREWAPDKEAYTGRSLVVEVTYLIRGPEWDVPLGMAVLSVVPVAQPSENGFPWYAA